MHDLINTSLYTEIKAVVDSLASNVKPGRRIQMANALTDFVTSAIKKYAKGEEEHYDSDITTCDLKLETRNEILDLFWYTTADRQWKE